MHTMNLHLSKVLIIFLTFIQVVRTSQSQPKLIETLLQNYNPMERPTKNYSIPTVVSVTFIPTKLIEVNEKEQSIKTSGWLTLRWYDPSLAWNPNEYGKQMMTTVFSESLWKPDIVLSNPIDEVGSFREQSINLVIYHNGTVNWYPYGLFVTGCNINVRNFPYDEQFCRIALGSGSYSPSAVYFAINQEVDLTVFQNNTEWELISIRSEDTYIKDMDYQEIAFVLHIKRKPLFVFFNMMVPCIFTVAVALLSFLIPTASGEKMSIGITTLLSSSVLLLVIASELPRCSDYVPLIGVFYGVSTGWIALICLASAFTLNLHHYGDNEEEVPICVKKMFFNMIGQIILFPRRVPLKKISYMKENSNEKIKLQWTLLADIFDRLFFYAFTIGIILSLTLIMSCRY